MYDFAWFKFSSSPKTWTYDKHWFYLEPNIINWEIAILQCFIWFMAEVPIVVTQTQRPRQDIFDD